MFKCNKTLVMGILNVTPDSFSDGGIFFDASQAVKHALLMQEQGADIIDVGGQSTRPGFTPICAKEELERIAPVIEGIRAISDITISVDTFYPEVAQQAIALGANIINDVSGFCSAQMIELAAQTGVGCIVMHSEDVTQCADVCYEVRNFFEFKTEQLKNAGIPTQNICFDPGIGFGKTYEQNLELIANFERICLPDYAMMIAASRKRVISNSCDISSPLECDVASAVAHSICVLSGATVVRAHNVPDAVQAARITDKIKEIKRLG